MRFTVISGGTGCNAIISAFEARTTFIIPISDNGGSSSEIQRVLGGPSVGDLRSRLVRLIPQSEPSSPRDAITKLLEYRLKDKDEWSQLLEGRHRLWKGIPSDRKECIRGFLVHVESAILKKAQRRFCYRKASVGNLFISGVSMFFGSIPSAIFLFASLTEIPHDKWQVVPVINTTSTATIAAELTNGEIITGQSEISHPAPDSKEKDPFLSDAPLTPTSATPGVVSGFNTPAPGITPVSRSTSSTGQPFYVLPTMGDEEPAHSSSSESESEAETSEADIKQILNNTIVLTDPFHARHDTIKASTTPRKIRTKKPDKVTNPNMDFDKNETVELDAPIKRIYYINGYGSEIYPRVNPVVLEALNASTCLVYSIGSLYTSLAPCLALKTMATTIMSSTSIKYKILLLNSFNDRETPGYSGTEFMIAIRDALAYGEGWELDTYKARVQEATAGNSNCDSMNYTESKDDKKFLISNYITHVVYLPQGQVQVDEAVMEHLGVIPVKAHTDSTTFDEKIVRDAFTRILR